ncbi:MAG: prepilin-type N-terminal cleavage/methylation domain-containing protein [Desulfuromonadaceae bacterium]|nr:prepilin-type N-terminal cleavage/methylation domain-containing protein [Desulfuromonadaceae bacterium]
MKGSNSMVKNLRNNKGFTLIEMAIVLVIIGIIIGAVVKGQDLVDNAKAKQFASKVQAWQIALNTYYDRKGSFPGDSDKDGVIASNVQNDIASANFATPPESNFVIGGSAFYIYLGNGQGSSSSATSIKNYLVACKDVACANSYEPDTAADLAALKYFESYDTSVDSTADAKAGSVQALKAATQGTGVVTGITTGVTGTDWLTGTDIKGLALLLK